MFVPSAAGPSEYDFGGTINPSISMAFGEYPSFLGPPIQGEFTRNCFKLMEMAQHRRPLVNWISTVVLVHQGFSRDEPDRALMHNVLLVPQC